MSNSQYINQLSTGYIALITISIILIIFGIIYYRKYNKDIKYKIKTIKRNLSQQV